MLKKKDEKLIKKLVIDERECGHLLCDFDDYEHDLIEIAQVVGRSWEEVEPDDEDADTVLIIEDRDYVEECLQFYYDLH